MRYILFLLTATFFSCNVNSPQKAADEYCECLKQQYSSKADATIALGYCDSLIATRYKELHTYYVDKDTDEASWDSAVNFYNKFLKLTLKKCCGLVGNCSVIDFRNSLLKHFSSYSFSHDFRAFDLIEKMLLACNKQDTACKYKIDFQEKLLSTDSSNTNYNSSFYYEIVIFDNAECLDKMIIQIQQNSCEQKPFSRIMSYARIDKKTLLLCNYHDFDFERMKNLLERTLHVGPVITLR